MQKSHYGFVLGLLFVAAGGAYAETPEIEFKQVSITGQFDNGQVVKGRTHPDILGIAADQELDNAFFTRTGVWVTQEAVVNERLNIIVGVGGIFWYSLPSRRTSPLTLQTQFGPGISQAQGIYTWGDLDNPTARLQMGYFPYSYNADAKNLGEYLMRSGTYPGYVVTGGWNMVSSATFMTQGLRLNVPLWDGKFQSDFLLAMETNLPPLFSLTPAYVARVTPVQGVTFGAGIACNHCISPRPSEEAPKLPANRIINSATVTADSTDSNFDGTNDALQYTYTYDRADDEYYTFQGIKVSANASFDPKAFVPMDFLGPEDLKVYGEIAVLGWKNYSYLYEDRTERMPVMGGVNLPTRIMGYSLLDVLSLEVEYYNNPFVNNYRNVLYDAIPMWYLPDAGIPVPEDEYNFNQRWTKRDNWKWSVYAKKEVTPGVRVYAQAASDHMRPYAFDLGAYPAFVPVTNDNGREWYYIVRLEFGI